MAAGAFAGSYAWSGTANGARTRLAGFSGGYGWAASFTGSSPKRGRFAGSFRWALLRAVGDNHEQLPDDGRFRVIVQQSRAPHAILSRDLVVTNLVWQRVLSGPCTINCDVNPNEPSAQGIYFKPWAQYVHIERVIGGKRKIVCSGIVQPSDVDPGTGLLHLKAQGFAGYPKGMPWLQDESRIVNDAYQPVVAIWDHLQSYPNGDLGVTVTPQTSGVKILPGYGYDGSTLNLNFWATFNRATDRVDCGEYVDALARDTPFDYREASRWNAAGDDVIKTIELGYPRLGVIQETLAFIVNENVASATPHIETQTDWVSDVGVSGWFPGVEYSFELANADSNRLRRYLDDQDAQIDSNERAAAWAHRRLARRQTPAYWSTITIRPNHPNAPFGSFDVGDTITISGPMPWVGPDITQEHKIMSIGFDVAKGECQLTLKAEGAFNYDPIVYPANTTNILGNGGFDFNLVGWNASGPGWSRDGAQGVTHLGAATITADGADHDLLGDAVGVDPFQIFPLTVWVKCDGAVSSANSVQLVVQFYDDDINPTQAFEVAGIAPRGAVAWQKLTGKVITPTGSTHAAIRLHVGAAMTAGRVWFDDAEMVI
jgi:hypothetical protein